MILGWSFLKIAKRIDINEELTLVAMATNWKNFLKNHKKSTSGQISK
jgi:hypothetical protein